MKNQRKSKLKFKNISKILDVMAPNSFKVLKKFFLFGLVGTVFLFKIRFFGYTCLFRRITGIPCPGCGMVRAFLALLKGQVLHAFIYHPLWIVVIIYPLLCCYCYFKKSLMFVKWLNNSLKMVVKLFIITWIFRLILFYPVVATI